MEEQLEQKTRSTNSPVLSVTQDNFFSSSANRIHQLPPTMEPQQKSDEIIHAIVTTYANDPRVQSALNEQRDNTQPVNPNENNAVGRLLSQVSQFPVLSYSELQEQFGVINAAVELITTQGVEPTNLSDEHENAMLAATVAYQRIYISNIKLVVQYAKSHAGRNFTLDEAIAEGYCGLDKAIRKFDTKKGFRFSTYARWWIKQSIQKAKPKFADSLTSGRQADEKYSDIIKCRDRLQQQLGRSATLSEVATDLQIPLSQVHDVIIGTSATLSIDKLRSDSSSSQNHTNVTLAESLTSDRDAKSFSAIEHRIVLLDLIERAQLTDAAKIVLSLRSGVYIEDLEGMALTTGDQSYTYSQTLLSFGPLNFEEIATMLGVTKQAVQQHHSRTEKKLRNLIK